MDAADTCPRRRIVVVGSTGSGKTTLAKALAARLGYPHVELDSLHWDPGWSPAPRDVFRARIATALTPDCWVVDGNYSVARDLVWESADLLVWLDYPLRVILPRLLLRSLKRGLLRQELWNGNREQLTDLFASDAPIRWSIATHSRRRREYPAILAQPQFAGLQVVRHASPGETDRWLRGFDGR
jgi:adenylate kinase family enzyme